jgi:3-dehydroquinate synthase
MRTKFSIDNTKFEVEFNSSAELTDFKVKSFPRDYSVIFSDSIEKLASQFQNEEIPVVIDSNVYQMHRAFVDEISRSVFKVAPEEANKTAETALKIVKFMDDNQINKGRPILAFGGGIIQDLAGFASGVYKRGVPWIYCPTTLLGQADSCIGGKTGLNFNGKKNVVCSFSAPYRVFICSDFIQTLSDQHIRCGLGEMFRLGLTGGNIAYNEFELFIKSGEPVNIKNIKESLLIKRAVVERDEYEINERRAMNVGHTVGHALEAATNNVIPHGIAVAYGIGIEALMASSLIGLPEHVVSRIFSVLKLLKSNEEIKIIDQLDLGDLLEPLLTDKKLVGNTLNFALLKDIGKIEFHPVEVKNQFDNLKVFVKYFVDMIDR